MNLSPRLRGFAASLAVLAAVVSTLGSAQASPGTGPQGFGPKHSCVGVVTNIEGSATSPSGITVQLGLQTWSLKLVPQTVITARSTEADLEGLAIGDYAQVTGRFSRAGHPTLVLARHITYDVQPFMPLKLFSGTFVQQSLNGNRLQLKLDNGRNLWVRLAAKTTRFHQDGHIVDQITSLAKGQTLQVLATRSAPGTWLAAEITLVSGSANHF